MKNFTTILYSLFFCFLVMPTSGQIISTDINLLINSSNWVNNQIPEWHLDMNGDGQDDFTLQFVNIGNIYHAKVGSHQNNEIAFPAYLDITVFNAGQTISPSTAGWNPTPDIDSFGRFVGARLAYQFWPGPPTDPIVAGNFYGLSNRFIGVRFFDDGNTYYGYIEVSCVIFPEPGYFEIVSMGYNSVPDMPIEAGQEGCDLITFYMDGDSDGFGDPNNTTEACDQPAGYVLDNTDCDDSNNMIYPDAQELCNGEDDNCNGLIDDNAEVPWYQDLDMDGFGNPLEFILSCDQPQGYIADNTDCNDLNPFINPNEFELCNGMDDNCDGIIDEDFPYSTWYADTDGDGFGDPNTAVDFCEQPDGYVDNNTDCDDSNNQIYPGVFEACNGIDDNCDGQIDEDVLFDWYLDADGDGFGNIDSLIMSCSQPQGYVELGTDCNDENGAINPDAMELCNGIDDNCDGEIDEGFSPQLWYQDLDGDAFGNEDESLMACEQPAGYVMTLGDCNDDNNAINPDADEICNGLDDNCNGEIDEETPDETWYEDKDGDGFGDNSVSIEDCLQPEGYVLNNDDCDDTNSAVHPEATEACNGVDDNCNGLIDDEVTNITFYYDGDGDGFGREDMTKDTCTQPVDYVLQSGDCNDDNIAINPDAKEVCNSIDDNCDGTVDETNLAISLYSQEVTEFGGSDGSAWVIVEGGDAPYSYLWNTNLEDSLITNLEIGEYSVTVSDNSNCSKEGTVTVNGPLCDSLAVVFYSIDDVLCYGNCNGSFEVDSIQGVVESPYTYLWSDGFTSTESYRENLCPGTYSVTITDALGCQSEVQFEIVEPEELIVGLNPDSTYVVFGGSLPVIENTYWNEGLFFFIQIEDSNGCIATDSLLLSSTDEQDALHAISIFPTITSDQIMVEYPIDMNLQNLKLRLFGIDGRLKKVFKNEEGLSIGEFSAGLYILKLDYGRESLSKQIVIIE